MFEDRAAAGAALAQALAPMNLVKPVVLALPRGGVPVALPVAAALGAPLDLLLVRKIGMPGNAELAAGAVAEGEAPLFNASYLEFAGLSASRFADAVAREKSTNAARRQLYLGGRAPLPLAGRTAVVVDDGIATGATTRAALMGLAPRRPAQVILAVPVAPPDAVDELRALVDKVVCLLCPDPFWAVGAHYRDFTQVSDAEVADAFAAAEGSAAAKEQGT